MKPRNIPHNEQTLFEVVAHVESEMETRLSGYSPDPALELGLDWEGVRLHLTPYLYVQFAPELAQKLSQRLREQLLDDYPWIRTHGGETDAA